MSLSVFSVAEKIPGKGPANLYDNVLTCGVNVACTNKVMFGKNYKVIDAAKFTVMVSISSEGAYTRADVSIENHAGYSQGVSPQDFRIEETAPKPKVLLYVPPSELHLPPPPLVAPVTAAKVAPAAGSVTVAAMKAPVVGAAATDAVAGDAPAAARQAAPGTPNIDELYAAAKREQTLKEAAEKEAAQKHLEARAIPGNEVVRGRVYFEKDPKAKEVKATVVIPVAGLVFEFPYTMKD